MARWLGGSEKRLPMAEVLRQCGSPQVRRLGLPVWDLTCSGFAQSGKSFKGSSGCSRNSIRDPTTPDPSAGARGAREPRSLRAQASSADEG